MWLTLKNSYGYCDEAPLSEIHEHSAYEPVESTVKGFCTLLGDLSYCQDSAGNNNKTALNYPTFLHQFAKRLPPLFQEEYNTRALKQYKLQTCDDLMNFVRRSVQAIERNPNDWKLDKNDNKNNYDHK